MKREFDIRYSLSSVEGEKAFVFTFSYTKLTLKIRKINQIRCFKIYN